MKNVFFIITIFEGENKLPFNNGTVSKLLNIAFHDRSKDNDQILNITNKIGAEKVKFTLSTPFHLMNRVKLNINLLAYFQVTLFEVN